MIVLMYMMLIHFVADFLLQSREMGQKKSSEPIWLLRHILIQWIVFVLCLFPVLGIAQAIMFSTANMIIHGIIDWNIWRLYKVSVALRFPELKLDPSKAKDFKYWEDHVFYSTIGFDQMLHVLTLIGLFSFL